MMKQKIAALVRSFSVVSKQLFLVSFFFHKSAYILNGLGVLKLHRIFCEEGGNQVTAKPIQS